MDRGLALVPSHDEQAQITTPRIEVLLPGALGRAGLERFIGDAYARLHGARIGHFARHLVGLRGCNGEWLAGVGYTIAHEQPLFLEQYLDRPIEIEIGYRAQAAVARGRIVEVGNLAANSAGAARAIIFRMATFLHSLDLTWAAFTSSKTLLNSFARLHVSLLPLAAADPGRLPDGGRNWGSYYATCPHVFAASIPAGFQQLRSTQLLPRAA